MPVINADAAATITALKALSISWTILLQSRDTTRFSSSARTAVGAAVLSVPLGPVLERLRGTMGWQPKARNHGAAARPES